MKLKGTVEVRGLLRDFLHRQSIRLAWSQMLLLKLRFLAQGNSDSLPVTFYSPLLLLATSQFSNSQIFLLVIVFWVSEIPNLNG